VGLSANSLWVRPGGPSPFFEGTNRPDHVRIVAKGICSTSSDAEVPSYGAGCAAKRKGNIAVPGLDVLIASGGQ